MGKSIPSIDASDASDGASIINDEDLEGIAGGVGTGEPEEDKGGGKGGGTSTN
ncbi:hypothetical protein [Streptomyces sp. NPDC095817]|uniref:hypothetical protein n=1 Tax=Streptomyces sp. NPDC095817 TaxID=3155082 RepID=UPI0033225834